MRPIPEGQLCQAKDEFGFIPFEWNGEAHQTWGLRRVEISCPHPAMVRWGDFHDFNHGGGQFWCEHCAIDALIAHIVERVKALDELREKRKTACLSDGHKSNG